jgi:hypothetical protein
MFFTNFFRNFIVMKKFFCALLLMTAVVGGGKVYAQFKGNIWCFGDSALVGGLWYHDSLFVPQSGIDSIHLCVYGDRSYSRIQFMDFIPVVINETATMILVSCYTKKLSD